MTAGWFGPYELIDRLGMGGSAEVFVARGPSTEHPVVALKRPRHGEGALRDAVALLRTEAALTLSVEHPNIVRGVETGEVEGEPYLSVELMIGETVLEISDVMRARDMRCPAGVGVGVLLDGLLALSHLHGRPDPIVHGDVTARNLMFCADGRTRLFDFGLARRLSTPVRTRADAPHKIVGTPGYIAPELIRGAPTHPGSDLFGLGASLYKLLSGRPIYEGATPEILAKTLAPDVPELAYLRPDLPPWLRGVVGTLLAKEARNRPPDAGELVLTVLHRAVEDGTWWSRAQLRRWLDELTHDTLEARAALSRRARNAGKSSARRASAVRAGAMRSYRHAS